MDDQRVVLELLPDTARAVIWAIEVALDTRNRLEVYLSFRQTLLLRELRDELDNLRPPSQRV